MTHDIAKKKTIAPYIDGWVIILDTLCHKVYEYICLGLKI